MSSPLGVNLDDHIVQYSEIPLNKQCEIVDKLFAVHSRMKSKVMSANMKVKEGRVQLITPPTKGLRKLPLS